MNVFLFLEIDGSSYIHASRYVHYGIMFPNASSSWILEIPSYTFRKGYIAPVATGSSIAILAGVVLDDVEAGDGFYLSFHWLQCIIRRYMAVGQDLAPC